jgi:hypothetical protein
MYQRGQTLAARAFFQLCCAVCCVSFWFWREIGFGLLTNVLRVQYSCGVVLVFWLRLEIVLGVTYTYLVYNTVVRLCQFLGCTACFTNFPQIVALVLILIVCKPVPKLH